MRITLTRKNYVHSFIDFLFSNFLGKICISDHVMNAKEEFLLLESEFENLKKKSKVETKIYDKLKKSLLEHGVDKMPK